MGNELTIIIKTFERKKELSNLLNSIVKMNLNYKILIADDSKQNYKEDIVGKFKNLNIDYHILPFDSGLSYGRNFLLKRVKTNYFILFDDDVVIDGKFDIFEAMQIMKHNNLDILGGYLRNYKTISRRFDYVIRFVEKIFSMERNNNYIGNINIKSDTIEIKYILNLFPAYTETDLTHNLFIGRTKSIERMGGWENDLKLTEHTDFFIKCKKANLKVAFTNILSAKHFPNKLGIYADFRNRYFAEKMLEIHNVSKIYFNYEDVSRNHVLEYNDNGESVKRSNDRSFAPNKVST